MYKNPKKAFVVTSYVQLVITSLLLLNQDEQALMRLSAD